MTVTWLAARSVFLGTGLAMIAQVLGGVMGRLKKLGAGALPVIAVVLLGATAAHAQATRTWVSGVGDDANPCSRTAPCKTFAGAISKTAAGGEIDVLDPGGYGAVTITKSISIEAEGALAGVLVSGTNAIIVNAAASDVVVIRGLLIEGISVGLSGIKFLAGGALHVENCTINKFGQYGIEFTPSGPSQLFVKDSIIRGNGIGSVGGGILVKPAGGSAVASVDNVRLEKNVFGLRVEDSGQATVHDSVAASNGYAGFTARSTTAQAILNLDSIVTVANGTVGLRSDGAYSNVVLSNVRVTGNPNGLLTTAGGQIASFGNNTISGNTTDGAPTTSYSQQ